MNYLLTSREILHQKVYQLEINIVMIMKNAVFIKEVFSKNVSKSSKTSKRMVLYILIEKALRNIHNVCM